MIILKAILRGPITNKHEETNSLLREYFLMSKIKEQQLKILRLGSLKSRRNRTSFLGSFAMLSCD